MTYELREINERIRQNVAQFVADCDAAYHKKVEQAADLICGNLDISPVVLLSGPSGSGKTTTALKIEAELRRRGINTRTISLDKYFKTVDFDTAPRTPEGELCYESPLCLDMDLLNEHFTLLNEHREIRVPHFIFAEQRRSASRFTPLKLGAREIAIFEGIHALNDEITDAHPEAFKLYVSARSNIADGAETVFKGTWMRLVRRVVRDNNFRASDAAFTMKLWANVRRGEKMYISPFKNRADYQFDSTHPYEVGLLGQFAEPLFAAVPPGVERAEELTHILPAFSRFERVSENIVAPTSLMREFIGGGAYEY